MKYRVFIEDVGPGLFNATGYTDVEAASPLDAIFRVTEVDKSSPVGRAWLNGSKEPTMWGQLLIALPVARQDLWPDGKTGNVPVEALRLQSANGKPPTD